MKADHRKLNKVRPGAISAKEMTYIFGPPKFSYKVIFNKDGKKEFIFKPL